MHWYPYSQSHSILVAECWTLKTVLQYCLPSALIALALGLFPPHISTVMFASDASGQFHQANTHCHCLWLINRWRLTEWELVLDSQTLGYNRSRAAMHRWPTPPLHRVCCEVREVRRRKWTVLDAMMEDDQPKLKPPTPSPLLDLEHSPGASSVTNHAEV